ncbi:MAG: hypothetical protein VYD19_08565 [Myxococcota bacterium]|nr:hypothetical protein [Myxococcota bacterium]
MLRRLCAITLFIVSACGGQKPRWRNEGLCARLSLAAARSPRQLRLIGKIAGQRLLFLVDLERERHQLRPALAERFELSQRRHVDGTKHARVDHFQLGELELEELWFALSETELPDEVAGRLGWSLIVAGGGLSLDLLAGQAILWREKEGGGHPRCLSAPPTPTEIDAGKGSRAPRPRLDWLLPADESKTDESQVDTEEALAHQSGRWVSAHASLSTTGAGSNPPEGSTLIARGRLPRRLIVRPEVTDPSEHPNLSNPPNPSDQKVFQTSPALNQRESVTLGLSIAWRNQLTLERGRRWLLTLSPSTYALEEDRPWLERYGVPACAPLDRDQRRPCFSAWRQSVGRRRKVYFSASQRLEPGWWAHFHEPRRPKERLYIRIEDLTQAHQGASLSLPLSPTEQSDASKRELLPLIDLVYRGEACNSDLCIRSEARESIPFQE